MPALKNPRHEAFAQAFVRGEHAGNATACYRVFYGRDDRAASSRLQRRHSIAQRIDEIRAEITASDTAALAQATERLGVSKEWVLKMLVEIAERSTQKKAVLDDDGNVIGEWKFDSAGANKALELIGKHLGMFVSVGDTHSLNVNLMFVDRPPVESREEWLERRKHELLPKPNGHANGNGRAGS
jgi:hypothetical protein